MKKRGFLKFLVGITLAASGAFAVGSALSNKKAEIVEASVGKATKDYPMIINWWNDVDNMYSGNVVAVYCWGGDLEKAITIPTEKLTDHMAVGIFPKGAASFKVVKVPTSVNLPCEGWPSSVSFQWNDLSFDSTKNVVTLKSYSASEQEYNDNKAILLKDRPVMFDISSDIQSWWFSGATTYAVAIGNLSGWFDYNHNESWHEVTRIGSTGYVYFVPTSTIISNGVVLSRNQTNQTGWDKKFNQSTDMYAGYGFNPLYVTQIEKDTSGSNQNWLNQGAGETASHYGCYFMDKITCDGNGNITSSSTNWTAVADMFNHLTADVQDEIKETVAAASGTNIAKAMYQYDYIVFFKHYSGYNDFAERANSLGKAFSERANMPALISRENNSLVSIIVIVSLISVTAIGGYFFIRRRKSI